MIEIGAQLLLKKDRSETYRCKIVETEEEAILIDYPVNAKTEKTAFIVDGTRLEATFTTAEQSVFSFKTEVIGREKRNIPMIRLSYPGNEKLEKVQRRRYVRVETPIDVAVEAGGRRAAFVTEDISAGGCALIARRDVPFKTGESVSVLLVLPFLERETAYVWLKAEVIRIWKKQERTIISLVFSEEDEQAKQLIVRFCFERQLQMRRKEVRH